MGLITDNAKTYYQGADTTANTADDDYGNYQFISIANIVNNFMIAYVGENKIISKIKKTDALFHAKRGIQELHFDTLPSTKAIEAEIGAALSFTLPQDYVNYVSVSFTDEDGIEQIIYPTRHTSNPTSLKGTADNPTMDGNNLDLNTESTTLTRFKAAPASDTSNDADLSDSDIFDLYRFGNRYGISPEQAQAHGVYYIDQLKGVIRFSSNMSGKIVTLKYISDGLGADGDMQVHKFAEEAIYKYIAHAILSTRNNVPEFQIARYKKDLRAAKRNAKLRLSNIKIRELAQVMRNQAKWIKH